MISVKRGDTLAFIARRKNADGTPRTGEAAKLRSQVRTPKGLLLAELVVTEVDPPGDYLFQVGALITKDWPVGTHDCDIQFKDGDTVISSTTFNIVVVKDVTRDE